MFSKEKGFYGGHGIVGAQVSLGVGLAFAHKYREDGGAAFAYFGDGAANQGQVYESYNLAKIWDLPVVFLIENNKYGMGTAVTRAAAGEGLYKRGEGFGIPAKRVDGMDVVAVMHEGQEAAEYARENGPIILEMETYRYRGHSMSDPAKYRSRDEVSKMRDERDPIESLRGRALEAGLMTEAEVKALDQEVRGIVAEAAEFAQQSPEPDPKELYTDILLDA
jgi:pyruvate dehydrogenase E1 component alpha subunit